MWVAIKYWAGARERSPVEIVSLYGYSSTVWILVAVSPLPGSFDPLEEKRGLIAARGFRSGSRSFPSRRSGWRSPSPRQSSRSPSSSETCTPSSPRRRTVPVACSSSSRSSSISFSRPRSGSGSWPEGRALWTARNSKTLLGRSVVDWQVASTAKPRGGGDCR